MVHDPVEAGQSRRRRSAACGPRSPAAPGGCCSCPATARRSTPAEVDELLTARAEPGVVIVPDRHGSGTNALLLDPPTVIAPAFGPGSFARHAALAAAADAKVRVGRLPSLELDVDTPGDLAALRAALEAPPRRRAAHARAARAAGQRGLRLEPLPGLPEVRPGDDLAALLAAAGARLDPPLGPADVLVIAHKVVSKAEGRVRALADIEPSARALELATEHDKDARHVQAILDETAELVRADRGRLICRTRHGFVCANAGVDQSNTGGEGVVVLLPVRPRRLGASAALRARRRRRRDQRLLGPPLASGAGRGRDRLRGAARRWSTTAAGPTATAARWRPA